MNRQITNLELIENYKGIEIYKHHHPLLSPMYYVLWINGKEYSGLIRSIRKTKRWITRALNKTK